MEREGVSEPSSIGRLPFVSVIVPAYNAAGVIGECIEKLLSQDYPRDLYEVIIVDNDSTDGTAAVIKRYPVKYVFEDKVHNPAGARNAGARHARGEALAFCDADQVATRPWLRELMSHWEDEGYAGFVGPYVPKAFGDGLFETYCANTDDTYTRGDGLCEVDKWGSGNLGVRAEDFRRAEGFRESMATGEDMDFCQRLCQLTGARFLYIGTAMQYHRARRSFRQAVRQRIRLGYGSERCRAENLLEVPRSLGRTALVAAWFCARLPFLVPKILILGAEPGRRMAVLNVVMEAVIDAADLLGRLAYRAGLSERMLRGM